MENRITLEEHEAEIQKKYDKNPGLQCRCPDDSGSCEYCRDKDSDDA